MTEGIELCGIKLGELVSDKRFKIKTKTTVPGGDYLAELDYSYDKDIMFQNINIIHSVGDNKISGVTASNGDGYTRGDSLNFINKFHNYYYKKYNDTYDIYLREYESTLFYLFHFYPPNYNVISFTNPKSSELKEPITSLLICATENKFKNYFTIEAMLSYFEDTEDDKSPEELDYEEETEFLKVVGFK